MRINLIILFFLSIAHLSGCERISENNNSGRCDSYREAGVACHLPIYAVLVDPDRYVGQEIQLKGFMVAGVSAPALYVGREAWLATDNSSAVALTGSEEIIERLVEHRFSYINMRGVVEGVYPNMSQPNVMLRVERFDVVFVPNDLSDREIILQSDFVVPD